ncbi:claspin [Anopheles merus]|uniref:claspin n=1 Tax=Anopheles merus TaxID=30066 RepID=UPI001BE45AA0|nr:claspin [Anopheles merus]
MEYDSDSELHATDTLRCESDSEEDDQRKQNRKLPENKYDDDGESVSKDSEMLETVQESAITDVPKNGSSDEEDPIGHRTVSTGRKSKVSNIIDSESDEEQATPEIGDKEVTPHSDNRVHLNRLQSLLDSDSSEQEVAPQEKKVKPQTKRKLKKSANELGTLASSDSEGESEVKIKTNVKEKRKRKKDTKTEETPTVVRSARDILASLNLFFDDDDLEGTARVAAQSKYSPSAFAEKTAYSSSEEESAEGMIRSARSARKMTAKQAMEDKQIIQSESQRMAREKYIDVPYHRTKVFSFEEFRARKTICKPDPARDCKESAATANKSIRMNAAQLEEFARKLAERELESQNFFKSESDSAEEAEPEKDVATDGKPDERQENVTLHDSQDKNDQEHVQPNDEDAPTSTVAPAIDQSISSENGTLATETALPMSEEQMDPIDEIVNRTSDNMEQMMASFSSEAEKSSVPETEPVQINYDLFSNESPAGASLTSKKASLLANLKLPPCPRLSGSSDMLIDLDSGSLQPKEPSGVDILFQRLAKCSGSAQKPTTPTAKAVSILSTEHGVVKLDTVTLFSSDERPLVHKEPIPGAAYHKLKQVLKEKIDNNRREYIRKREAEFAKKMDLEKAEQGDPAMDEEEEEIELLDEDEDEEDEVEQEEAEEEGTKANADGPQIGALLDDQALDDEVSEADESSSSDEDEEDDHDTAGASKKAGRIIKAFEDSDDELQPANGEPKKLLENATNATTSFTLSSEGLSLASESATNNEQNDESLTLLWKNDEEQPDQREEEQEEDDLMALCSGQFATQLPTQKQAPFSQGDDHDGVIVSQANPKSLYTQNQEPFGESQLMDLCSGRFETQANDEDPTSGDTGKQDSAPDAEQPTDHSEILIGGRLRLDSSDEETERVESEPKRKVKKQRRKQINISDDEDDVTEPEKSATDVEKAADATSDAGDQEEEEVEEPDEEAEGDEDGERYVDYDSEENEVEVRLTKKEKELMSAKFLENEAELSESEWGSADEDEKDLDRYDVEVADEEQYDQEQLQQELEKIHNRQMLDQDDREVEQLKEFFLEDEEKDGVGRVRQFRWKNVEKTFSLDYDKNGQQEGEGDGEGNGSDEETELNWRKMRHERNLLLKEKNIDLSTIDLTATTMLNPADTTAVAGDEQENMLQASGKKRITIIKKGSSTSSAAAIKDDNPFLISNSSILQGHKASFLSRDKETLEKLANLIPESEGATSSLITAKARNFVFATLSPAVEKSSKRSLDQEGVEMNANSKKAKTVEKQFGSKKKLLLEPSK